MTNIKLSEVVCWLLLVPYISMAFATVVTMVGFVSAIYCPMCETICYAPIADALEFLRRLVG